MCCGFQLFVITQSLVESHSVGEPHNTTTTTNNKKLLKMQDRKGVGVKGKVSLRPEKREQDSDKYLEEEYARHRVY